MLSSALRTAFIYMRVFFRCHLNGFSAVVEALKLLLFELLLLMGKDCAATMKREQNDTKGRAS